MLANGRSLILITGLFAFKWRLFYNYQGMFCVGVEIPLCRLSAHFLFICSMSFFSVIVWHTRRGAGSEFPLHKHHPLRAPSGASHCRASPRALKKPPSTHSKQPQNLQLVSRINWARVCIGYEAEGPHSLTVLPLHPAQPATFIN